MNLNIQEIQQEKKQISYEDILSSINMFVNSEGKIELIHTIKPTETAEIPYTKQPKNNFKKNIPPLQPRVSFQTEQNKSYFYKKMPELPPTPIIMIQPVDKNASSLEFINNMNERTAQEEFLRKQQIELYNKRKRMSQIKSKKLFFSPNISISPYSKSMFFK